MRACIGSIAAFNAILDLAQASQALIWYSPFGYLV